MELVLAETGVCRTDLGGSSCCAISDGASDTTTVGASCSTSAGSCGVAEPVDTEDEPAVVGAAVGDLVPPSAKSLDRERSHAETRVTARASEPC